MNTLKTEDLNFLKELGKKMNEQNNRGTQWPMFVVMQKVKRYGESSWTSESERKDMDYCNVEDLCEKCSALNEEGEELPEYCPDCDDECFAHFNWEDEIVEDAGHFFTAEACEEHIRRNHYHYTKPFSYATGTWRNEEMQRVLNILSRLGDKNDIPKSFYR